MKILDDFENCLTFCQSPLAWNNKSGSLVAAAPSITAVVAVAAAMVAGESDAPCGTACASTLAGAIVSRTSVTIDSIDIPLWKHYFTFVCIVTVAWDDGRLRFFFSLAVVFFADDL